MRKRIIYWIFWILIFGTSFLIISIISLLLGVEEISFKKLFSIILKGEKTPEYSIIFDIRLPRIILGFAIGGGLSISGVILQGMFRNPLVEPYTLGISGGGALGVCLNMILGLYRRNIFTLPLFGFIGAGLIIIIIYILNLRKGILKMQGLLLTGVMLSFISSSLIMLIMSILRIEDLHGIVYWMMGSLEEPNWILIKIAIFISIIGLFVSYLFCFDLNALSLGEEEALHLGINFERTKRILFILASLITGCSVSIAGIIGFVGLVVPHFIRMMVGGDHRILLIGSFLCGAGFLVLCDTLARIIISPLELPVGVITGIVGGSLFIYALGKKIS